MDRIEQLDKIIRDMYNSYTGLEIADSIKRYRQEMDIRIDIELERKLLKRLKAKHEKVVDDDIADN